MLAKSVNRRLGLVAFLLLSVGASAPASAAAAPTRILACPYTITAPGNYVVTRNLSAMGTCISFATPVSNVALDLQGHSITGNGTGYGIACLQSGSNDRCDHVIIANGVVARFSGGIHLDGNFNTVAQMTSQQNTASQQNSGTGIVLNGDFGNLITGSVATGNDSEGIHGGGNGFATSVSDSVASNNGNFGIISIGGVSDSVANNNGGYGIVAQDGLVTGSTARGNALIGIMVENADYGSVVDSNALGNGGDGIVSSGNVISSTAIDNGDRGIVLSCPVSAFGNRAINNPGGNLVPSDSTCVLLDNKAP